MEIEKTIGETETVSAAGKEQKKSFLSVLKEKRKKIAGFFTAALTTWMMSASTAFAAAPGSNAGEAQFDSVINFFATWIGRVGLVVGFIGAIMFGLAIKNDDADAKTRGLMTLASGFVVYAVTKALDMFMFA